ncbi:copper resistance protein NlpE [Acinetobacter chinensis]|uniref:Copper resistance protein NlpE n=1 Tax=Acinetobacter chinensis TaxID=2004650 RepID=A0A3B7LYA8_9GAMM|nr:copper resistance protein NlpE [Acinetobacter chinensis]AXY57361.1 copper resistance protein NlpE [Acinetobacter chinensis]
MKKTCIALALGLVTTFSLTGCNKPKTEESAAPSTVESSTPATENPASSSQLPVADSAETSLDWAGEYKGVFPCADCSGIETELELKSDKTYELTEEYQGKGTGNEFKVKGTFSFDQDNPSIITLDKAAENRKFFVGENFVEARDKETGEALETKLNYKLQKELH